MNRLEFPNTSHRAEIERLWKEWKSTETPTSPGRLFSGINFDDFLRIAQADLVGGNEGGVPAHLLLLVQEDTNRILGAIQVRHHIDHPRLIEGGGHIGYGVRPSERQKGYATEMLGLALAEAKKLGLERVLITCSEDNIASRKTIEANGGIFERYTNPPDGDDKQTRRYWIDLEEREATKIMIKQAQLEDYESIKPLFEEGHTYHAENVTWKFRQSEEPTCSQEYYTSLIADPNVILLLAKNPQNEALGFITIRRKESTPIPTLLPRKYFFIDNLGVQSAHRGMGIGSKLMDRAEEIARAEGIEEIELNVWEFNESARELYDRRGYETVSRLMRRTL